MSRSWMLYPLFMLAACPKNKPATEAAAPVVGWFHEEGWLGDCYAPPDLSTLGQGERRVQRGMALTEVVAQWQGERGDGIAFDGAAVHAAETQMMRFPEKVDEVLQKNLQLCKVAMSGGGTSAWAGFVRNLASSLSAGECNHPLDVEMVWYLDISQGWQFGAPVCADQPIDIRASEIDEYRLDPKGPWITAAGDPNRSTAGDQSYPCSTESCLAGALILRFVGEDGSRIVRQVGTHLVFTPPSHGSIEVMINDTSFGDNTFKVDRGIQHHTQVTYKPAKP